MKRLLIVLHMFSSYSWACTVQNKSDAFECAQEHMKLLYKNRYREFDGCSFVDPKFGFTDSLDCFREIASLGVSDSKQAKVAYNQLTGTSSNADYVGLFKLRHIDEPVDKIVYFEIDSGSDTRVRVLKTYDAFQDFPHKIPNYKKIHVLAGFDKESFQEGLGRQQYSLYNLKTSEQADNLIRFFSLHMPARGPLRNFNKEDRERPNFVCDVNDEESAVKCIHGYMNKIVNYGEFIEPECDLLDFAPSSREYTECFQSSYPYHAHGGVTSSRSGKKAFEQITGKRPESDYAGVFGYFDISPDYYAVYFELKKGEGVTPKILLKYNLLDGAPRADGLGKSVPEFDDYDEFSTMGHDAQDFIKQFGRERYDRMRHLITLHIPLVGPMKEFGPNGGY